MDLHDAPVLLRVLHRTVRDTPTRRTVLVMEEEEEKESTLDICMGLPPEALN